MKKNLLLTILLGFLVIMNVTLLFLFFNKSPKKSKPPHAFVVKELQFNAIQMQKYEQLEWEFEASMRPLHERSRKLKDALFNSLSDENTTDRAIDSITTLIGISEKERDTRVFEHFQAIYQICDENQKERFKRIVNKALRPPGRGGPEKGGPGPPPRH